MNISALLDLDLLKNPLYMTTNLFSLCEFFVKEIAAKAYWRLANIFLLMKFSEQPKL